MSETDPVKAVLARHGVKDPMHYLLHEGANPDHSVGRHPDVTMRGSIYMMLNRFIDMKSVSNRLAKLRRA